MLYMYVQTRIENLTIVIYIDELAFGSNGTTYPRLCIQKNFISFAYTRTKEYFSTRNKKNMTISSIYFGALRN